MPFISKSIYKCRGCPNEETYMFSQPIRNLTTQFFQICILAQRPLEKRSYKMDWTYYKFTITPSLSVPAAIKEKSAR